MIQLHRLEGFYWVARTGGYARAAQVARIDRHVLGQLRPGDHVSFLPRTPDEANAELRAKHDAWREWLPGIEQVI